MAFMRPKAASIPQKEPKTTSQDSRPPSGYRTSEPLDSMSVVEEWVIGIVEDAGLEVSLASMSVLEVLEMGAALDAGFEILVTGMLDTGLSVLFSSGPSC